MEEELRQLDSDGIESFRGRKETNLGRISASPPFNNRGLRAAQDDRSEPITDLNERTRLFEE